MAQIINITSEALQATIRRLLPSQQGFGEDLQATNVVTPIIDLTPTAEGSSLPIELQTALAFGSQTAFGAKNSTALITNTAGFHRVTAVAVSGSTSSADGLARLQMSDGLSTKDVWQLELDTDNQPNAVSEQIDLVFFLDSGHSLSAISNSDETVVKGSVRQIANINGELVNPSGFNPQ